MDNSLELGVGILTEYPKVNRLKQCLTEIPDVNTEIFRRS